MNSFGKIRIGEGFDVHPLRAGRKLVLAGVEIPYEKGLDGHSDADALLHAAVDAVLGALAAGDIGQWFPDNDQQYRDIDSSRLMVKVLESDICRDWRLNNLDCTLMAEKPRLAEYILPMRKNLSRIFKVQLDQISVKATTCEKLGFIGRGEGIAAGVTVLMTRK